LPECGRRVGTTAACRKSEFPNQNKKKKVERRGGYQKAEKIQASRVKNPSGAIQNEEGNLRRKTRKRGGTSEKMKGKEERNRGTWEDSAGQ